MSFFETITPWDASVLQSIQGIKCDFLDTFMAVMSFLGEKGLIWIILGLTLCLFKKTRATGVIMLCAMTLGLLLGEFGIKNIICRPRPFVTYDFTVNGHIPSGYSFPSGHTSAVFATMTCITLMSHNRYIAFFCLVLAVVAAYSRIYLSQHFAEDIMLGSIVGMTTALAIYPLYLTSKSIAWTNKSLISILKIKA